LETELLQLQNVHLFIKEFGLAFFYVLNSFKATATIEPTFLLLRFAFRKINYVVILFYFILFEEHVSYFIPGSIYVEFIGYKLRVSYHRHVFSC
jgi:hypothetical protein